MKIINNLILMLLLCGLLSCKDSSTNATSSSDDNDSDFITQILEEHNRVRENPSKYADEVLTPMLQYFNGNIYQEPGEVGIITQEGKKAVEECIAELKTMSAKPKLSFAKGLCSSAQWLADDQASTGQIGHTGSDGSNPGERMSRYGTWKITWAENCAYGSKTPRRIITQLLIDDGVPSRGHRKNMMNENFKKIGIGYSDKDKAPYGAVSVFDYAGNYIDD